jgi:DNA-binding winged helix-turn-helix (wHTH) protein
MAGDSPTIRFGAFELDLRTGELRKAGRKVRIQEQPLCVLVSLLERPGELVTRDELRKKLWQPDTFVDFDTGLNKAITKIREVLADSAASPRFVETLPKRGYRFIAPIEKLAPERGARRTVEQIGAKLAEGAPAIAVLPFANMSTDKEDDYFSDGLAEEIINALTKVPGLRVIAPHVCVPVSWRTGFAQNRRGITSWHGAGRQRAQGRQSAPDHGSAHRCGRRFAHLVGALRP